MWHREKWVGCALAGALLAGGPALAGPDLPPGDGSDVNNARLLPDYYPDDGGLVVPGIGASGLREPYDPAFDVDWSVSLRGSYAKTGDEETLQILSVPSVTLTHQGSRSQLTGTASADITQPIDGDIDITGLRLGLEGGYQLDSLTALSANLDIEVTQDLPGTPGLATDERLGPETFNGTAGVGIDRQFGRFNLGVSGEASRVAYGDTTLNDGTLVNNEDQAYWALDGALRLGFQATPIFEVFTEAGVGREYFDLPSSVLLARQDATNSSIKAGVVGRWNGILEAEASMGLGLRRFDAASLGEITSRLYDARISFTPDPTWRFTAALSTVVAPPEPGKDGTTTTEYAVTGTADYTVNSWLALRAMANWHTDEIDDGLAGESGYGLGAGADYQVNAHTDLSADYEFERNKATSGTVEDSHRVTLGITLQR